MSITWRNINKKLWTFSDKSVIIIKAYSLPQLSKADFLGRETFYLSYIYLQGEFIYDN